MKWETFIQAIKESELESGTPPQILIKLFIKAGYINKKEDGISESTAKKWINDTRHCKVSSYFPDEKIVQTQELYYFFKRRPQNKLEKLQEILSKEIDDNSPIDCTTKDMDRFCWGLVNQFLDLLKFQRIDMPASDHPAYPEHLLAANENDVGANIDIEQSSNGSENRTMHQKTPQSTNNGTQFQRVDMPASDHPAYPEHLLAASENDVGANIDIEQSSNGSENRTMHQKTPQSINNGTQFAIPKECKICLYCENWKGNMQDAYNNTCGTLGRCRLYSKEILSTKGTNCTGFMPAYERVLHYQRMNIFSI